MYIAGLIAVVASHALLFFVIEFWSKKSLTNGDSNVYPVELRSHDDPIVGDPGI